jgi:hypothetical protein
MIEFSRAGDVRPTPKPQPGEPEYLSLSGISVWSCPTWVAVPVPATRTAIVYLFVGIKLSHHRTDIHIIAFFFQKMDLNKDGVVTLEEFLDSCRNDEDISQSMAVFDSAFWRTPVRGNPPPSWSWGRYWAVQTSKDCKKNGKLDDVKLQGWLNALLNGLQPMTAKYAAPLSLSVVLKVL